MSEPFIGEIILVGFNFAPQGWAFCDGSLLPISENDTLFALIGTTYGGDGQTTFGLPDLRGRVPIGTGQGQGLPSSYTLGESGGTETITLTSQQMPAHAHVLDARSVATARCRNESANSPSPVGHVPAIEAAGVTMTYSNQPPDAAMAGAALVFNGINLSLSLQNAGGSQPHDNMQPFLTMNYCISLFGIFPSPT